jgi:hypothetical protein
MAGVVQTKSNHNASAASIGVTLSPAGVAGNKLIVMAYIQDETRGIEPTVPASGWNLDRTANPAGAGQQIRWYSLDLAGGETTVTFETTDDVADTIGLVAMEWSGLLAGNTADDVGNSTTGASGTSRSTGSTGTLSQADEVAVFGCYLNGAFTDGAWDGGTLSDVTARFISGYQIVAATTAITRTASWTTSRFAHAGIQTYKAAVAATSPVRYRGYPRGLTRGIRH